MGQILEIRMTSGKFNNSVMPVIMRKPLFFAFDNLHFSFLFDIIKLNLNYMSSPFLRTVQIDFLDFLALWLNILLFDLEYSIGISICILIYGHKIFLLS